MQGVRVLVPAKNNEVPRKTNNRGVVVVVVFEIVRSNEIIGHVVQQSKQKTTIDKSLRIAR